MKKEFIEFLRDKGVFVQYYREFERGESIRRSWHESREYDFWDPRNKLRWVSGAFDWSVAEDRGIHWMILSNAWKFKCMERDMVRKINANSRVI